MTSTTSATHIKYRPEIDGLRAIAVAAVIFLHGGFSTFSGGYVGVDVFFVISGYLITLGLLQNLQAGTFSLKSFYERRARRILPALYFVLILSVLYATFNLSPHDMRHFVTSVLSVLAFGSNIYFRMNTGYFDIGAKQIPMLHTWSLGVEEQFYITFPLLLWVTWRLTRRSLPLVLVAILVLSFVWADNVSRRDPITAFYLPQFRAWELGVGALVAWIEWRRPAALRHRAFNEALSLAGLAAILYAILRYTGNTPFPGRFALLPVLGAGAVIAFATRETIVARALSMRPLVGIGLISYSLYLWHYPIGVFAQMSRVDPLTNMERPVLLALNVVAAWITWRYIETPFRGQSVIPRRRLLPIFAGSALSIVALCAFAMLGPRQAGGRGFGNELWSSMDWQPRRECLDIINAAKRMDNKWYCEINTAAESQPTFIVFGDSHAFALLNTFETIAQRDHKRGIFMSTSGCPPLFDVVVLDDITKHCAPIAARVRELIRTKGIRRIFLLGRWTHYTGEEDGSGGRYLANTWDDQRSIEHSRDVFTKALDHTLQEFTARQATVTIFDQVPYQPYDPAAVYRVIELKKDRANLLREYSVTRPHHDSTQAWARGILRAHEGPNIHVIDLDHILCDRDRCPIGDESHSYYIDNHHLTAAGIRRAEPWLVSTIHLADVVSCNYIGSCVK